MLKKSVNTAIPCNFRRLATLKIIREAKTKSSSVNINTPAKKKKTKQKIVLRSMCVSRRGEGRTEADPENITSRPIVMEGMAVALSTSCVKSSLGLCVCVFRNAYKERKIHYGKIYCTSKTHQSVSALFLTLQFRQIMLYF